MRPAAVSPLWGRALDHEIICRNLTVCGLCNPDQDLPLWPTRAGQIARDAHRRDANLLGEIRRRQLVCDEIIAQFHVGTIPDRYCLGKYYRLGFRQGMGTGVWDAGHEPHPRAQKTTKAVSV